MFDLIYFSVVLLLLLFIIICDFLLLFFFIQVTVNFDESYDRVPHPDFHLENSISEVFLLLLLNCFISLF